MHKNNDPVFCPDPQFLIFAFADQTFAINNLQSAKQLQNAQVQSLFNFQIF